MTLLAWTSAPLNPRNSLTLLTSSVLTIITPRISRTCGISSSSPFLRYTYFPPWLDVRCPYRRFTSSLALFLSYVAHPFALEEALSSPAISLTAAASAYGIPAPKPLSAPQPYSYTSRFL